MRSCEKCKARATGRLGFKDFQGVWRTLCSKCSRERLYQLRKDVSAEEICAQIRRAHERSGA